MKTLIKFDDLAFVLLFFFIMLAAVSLCEAESSDNTDNNVDSAYGYEMSENEETDVWIYQDGSLSCGYEKFGRVLLHCNEDITWKKVRDCVFNLKEAGNTVRIAVE